MSRIPLVVVVALASCVHARSFEPLHPAPSMARDRAVAVHVMHASDAVPIGTLVAFDTAMADALARELSEAGLTPITMQEALDNDVTLEVSVLFDTPDASRAHFTFYPRNAKMQEHSEEFTESGVAAADINTALPRSAAIHIVNALTTDTGYLLFLERQAAARRAVPREVAVAKGAKSIFVTPLKATGKTSPDTAHAITELLAARLSQHSSLRVVTPDDVDTALSAEKQRDLVGCNAVSCMAEIGGALGTSYVGYGDIGTIGSQYVLTFVTVDSSSAQVVSRNSKTVPHDEDQLVAAVAPFVAEIDAEWQSAGAR